MHGFVKVCQVEDVPPGKGKIVRVGERDVFVFNREGRVFAMVDARTGGGSGRAGAAAPGEAPAACRHPGSRFEVEQEDSLVEVGVAAGMVPVRVAEDGVFVAIDETGGPALAAIPG